MTTFDNIKPINIKLDMADIFDIDPSQICEEKASAVDTPKKIKKSIPWIEKYRPTNLNEIVQQTEIKKILNNAIATGNLPHMLLYGPPGTGKTSTILCLAKQLFGPNNYRERIIELNASDERGINIVRNKIMSFAKNAIGGVDPNYPSPPYKIIILDEADAMTTDAQSALRKIMETYSHITRFCFICNYINQIIEPINSRCAKFRFNPISVNQMKNKLAHIISREKINVLEEHVDIVCNMSNGDMRKAIMTLQNIKYSTQLADGALADNDIYNIIGSIPKQYCDDLVKKCVAINKKKVKHFADIFEILNDLKVNGYDNINIFKQLCHSLNASDSISQKQKSKIIVHIANKEKLMLDGTNEHLQLLDSLTFIVNNASI